MRCGLRTEHGRFSWKKEIRKTMTRKRLLLLLILVIMTGESQDPAQAWSFRITPAHAQTQSHAQMQSNTQTPSDAFTSGNILTPSDTLTLEQAHELVRERFPLAEQMDMQREIRNLRVKNIDAERLPGISLSGMAQYQSDVTAIDIQLPAMPNGFTSPSQPHDRYQIALDLEQRLYDGGRTRTRRELEKSRSDRAIQQIRVDQHELKNRVNDAWFAIHALRAQIRALEITETDLEQRLQEVRSRIAHGAMPATAADIIRAEQLRIIQQKRSLLDRQRAATAVLSQLLDTELPGDMVLLLPDVPERLPKPDFRQRPETGLFDRYRRELSEQEAVVTASYRPRVSAFGQAAYGRPGLNLFEDSYQPWYIVGVRASWPLWNWGTDDRERQIIQSQRQIIDNQQDIFNRNMHMAVQNDIERIYGLRETIQTDHEIITLHENIVKDAAIRLENGTITATEYISELSNRQRALVNRELHRIELARAWQNYLTILGH